MKLIRLSLPKERSNPSLVARVLSVVLISSALTAWWASLSALFFSDSLLADEELLMLALLGVAFAATGIGIRLMHRWAVFVFSAASILFFVDAFMVHGFSASNPLGMTITLSSLIIFFVALFLLDHREEFK